MSLSLKHPGPADQFTEMKQDVLAWNTSPTRPVSRRNCRAPQPCSCTSSFTGNIFIACTTRPSTSSLSSSSTSRGMASKRGGKQVGRELGLCRGFGSADEFYCAILLSCSVTYLIWAGGPGLWVQPWSPYSLLCTETEPSESTWAMGQTPKG